MSADPMQAYVDELIRFENRERYVAQSKATEVNAPAPLPERKPALPFINPDRSNTR